MYGHLNANHCAGALPGCFAGAHTPPTRDVSNPMGQASRGQEDGRGAGVGKKDYLNPAGYQGDNWENPSPYRRKFSYGALRHAFLIILTIGCNPGVG